MYEKEDKDFILAAYIANAFFLWGGYLLILLWFLGRGYYSGHPEIKRHLKQIIILWVLWFLGMGILGAIYGGDVIKVTTIGKIWFILPSLIYITGIIQVWREKAFAIF